jgi:hypothetical protein
MKSKVIEITVYSGNFRNCLRSKHNTMRAAKAEASRLNQARRDHMGVSNREYWNDRSNYEGSFHALRMDEVK